MRRALPLVLVAVACARVSADELPRADAAVLAPPEDGGAQAALDSADVEADASAADAGPKPITQHRFVLHVGDSTVGYTLGLQLELARKFKAAKIHYESRTVTAAGLHAFATERILEKALRDKDPDLVIIQVGTNNLTVPHPDAYIPDLRSIVAQAGGRDCYWIGPIPIDRPEKGMRAVIRANVQPCTFFDSFDLDIARQPDNVHPTQGGAHKWAEAFWAFAAQAAPGR